MGSTFFPSFLCNSCNFQYFILGWPTLVLGPSIGRNYAIAACTLGEMGWTLVVFRYTGVAEVNYQFSTQKLLCLQTISV